MPLWFPVWSTGCWVSYLISIHFLTLQFYFCYWFLTSFCQWSEVILCEISIFLNLLRLTLWSYVFILENVPCVLEKNCVILMLLEWSVLCQLDLVGLLCCWSLLFPYLLSGCSVENGVLISLTSTEELFLLSIFASCILVVCYKCISFYLALFY